MVRTLSVAIITLGLSSASAQDAVLSVSSADGRWRLDAEQSELRIIDLGTGEVARTLPARSLDGEVRSAIASVHSAPARRSFVVVFKSLPEIWEISHDPQAEPIFNGFVHDYRMREGMALPGFLNARRTYLSHRLQGLAFSADHAYVLGRPVDPRQGGARLELIQLDVRRRIASFDVAGEPEMARARRVTCRGREMLVVPDRAHGDATVIDLRGAKLGPPACAVP